jgi:hypothetical protein
MHVFSAILFPMETQAVQEIPYKFVFLSLPKLYLILVLWMFVSTHRTSPMCLSPLINVEQISGYSRNLAQTQCYYAKLSYLCYQQWYLCKLVRWELCVYTISNCVVTDIRKYAAFVGFFVQIMEFLTVLEKTAWLGAAKFVRFARYR